MRDTLGTYVNKFAHDSKYRTRVAAILIVLAIVVAAGVSWQLHYTGIAAANETFCGLQEHQHSDECYEDMLVCGFEEGEYDPTVAGVHTHTNNCYETILICEVEEHTHTDECLTDPTEEDPAVINLSTTLPALSGVWADDIVAIAQSQLGYTESALDVVTENTGVQQGYTAYGEWYSSIYGTDVTYSPWDATFAAFCITQANVPQDYFPTAYASDIWVNKLRVSEQFTDTKDYLPYAGDLIFFDSDTNGIANSVGIVAQTVCTTDTNIYVIQADIDNTVEKLSYASDDSTIYGYGILTEQQLIDDTTNTESDNTEPNSVMTTEDVADTNKINDLEDGSNKIDTNTTITNNAEKDSYTIEYTSNDPDAVQIDGPQTLKEDSDLYFYANVNDGYTIKDVFVNNNEIQPSFVAEPNDDGISVYTYTVSDINKDTIVTLEATQTINGSGVIGVYKQDSVSSEPEYTLYINNVPTNTKINLDSPCIELKDSLTGTTITDEFIEGNLYYITNTGTKIEVSYLMLDGDIQASDLFVVTAYDKNDNPLDTQLGKLVLYTQSETITATLLGIQTNTLCYLDDKNNYQQNLYEIVKSAEETTYTLLARYEGIPINLESLTGHLYTEFYYGSITSSSIFDLTPCTQAVIEDNTVKPIDSKGNPVDGVQTYMVIDEVYSFDVTTQSIVNEHTEDNGDVYLWTGDTYYVDKYHAQGMTNSQYTNATATTGYGNNDLGVWVQLGRLRETAINSGSKNFSNYNSVSRSALTSEGVTSNIADAVNSSYDYGIAGSYKVPTGATDITPTTSRVTGHIGEVFTPTEEFNTSIVYMVTDEKTQYHTDWVDLGAHASDGGGRVWFYWINNYYQLNNYEDETEYLEINKTSTGEVRLSLDEIGEKDKQGNYGEKFDLWSIDGLYTKRNSVIKDQLISNPDTYTKDGIGFYSYIGMPHHIQLRMNGDAEVVINDTIYEGKLDVVDGSQDASKAPYIEYSLKEALDSVDGKVKEVSNSTTVAMDNEQEAELYNMSENIDGTTHNYYVNINDVNDADKVKITIRVNFYGTLNSADGDTITYTESDPLVYKETLTSEQLKDAYDTCPNSTGYDIAININEAIRYDAEKNIILRKIWDDDSNAYAVRDDIDFVAVTLERSKDGDDWETVTDDVGTSRLFTIRGSSEEDVWEQILTDDDLDLTYIDINGDTQDYEFRISSEQEIITSNDSYYYTSTIGEGGLSLTITNTLHYRQTITGTKQWVNPDGKLLNSNDIPDSITIGLYRDGKFYKSTVATKDDNFEFTFENLPQNIDQDAYEYTLCELSDGGRPIKDGGSIQIGDSIYDVTITLLDATSAFYNSYTITNTYTGSTRMLPNTGGMGVAGIEGIGLLLIAITTALFINQRRVKSPKEVKSAKK